MSNEARAKQRAEYIRTLMANTYDAGREEKLRVAQEKSRRTRHINKLKREGKWTPTS
tara:strand:- start:83 stop:253 length:171 start_codon:yes stop_codon:yes gene_type:complete